MGYRLKVCWALSLFVAVGCGGGGGGSKDGATDAADSRSDAGGSDMRADTGTDAGADAPRDTAADVAKDVGTDVGVDAADAADAGDAGGDAGPVPTMLTASVLDRRQTSVQLVWPAPTGNAGGYDIRVAKLPIAATASDAGTPTVGFDDATNTMTVPYTGTPAQPGTADGLVVKNLDIEQNYYFAVAPKDAGGTRGTIMATTTPTIAHFLTTMITGAGTDGIGVDLDGTGDFGNASDLSFTPDGYSDLIVGGLNGTHVYIYFGSASGYPATPSVTITGPARFGQAVVNAGDLDGDGLDDIAIASPAEGGGLVYVYSRKNPRWGSTTKWVAAMDQTQASYTLTADMTFAGGTRSISNRGLARLGNFDGTGTDDLAIGFQLHNAMAGAVLIVKGGASFASAAIPDTTGVVTTEVDGAAAAGVFGFSLMGIGPFYPAPAGPTLVSSALYASAIYAFRGQAGGPLSTATPDDSTVAPVADQYGYNLGFLGALGSSPGAVSVASVNSGTGYVDVHVGTPATGPFLGIAGGAPAPTVHFVDAAAGNSFGAVNLGGGVKGTSQKVSFIGGDAVPDLILAGQGETDLPIYLINGAAIGASLTGSVDVSAARAEVVPPIIRLPGKIPWVGYGGATVIVDSNKDGYADFALGESGSARTGRVIVFY
jgi:hypothetical protein